MPGWLKVILIIILILIALVVGAGFIGYHWIKTHAPELKAQGEKVRADAVAFGTGKTPDACVDETFTRLRRCDGLMCEAMTKIFLTRCVAASEVPEGFCAPLPKPTEFIASAKWAMAECARRGHSGDQRCTRVITGLQDYCEKR